MFVVVVVVVVVAVVVGGVDSVVCSVVTGATLVSVVAGVVVVTCTVVVLVGVVVVVLRFVDDVVVPTLGAWRGASESRDTCTMAITNATITARPPTPARITTAGRWCTRWIVMSRP